MPATARLPCPGTCLLCEHRGDDPPETACEQPDLYDLDNDANAEFGTSAAIGEAIREWRDGAWEYDGLAVVGHDNPCPGFEPAEEP